MTVYRALRPVLHSLGKRTFYVTVARHSDEDIRDIAAKTGFVILSHENGYYLFEKIGEPSFKIEAQEFTG